MYTTTSSGVGGSGALWLHLILLTLSPVLITVIHALLARINSRLRPENSNQLVCLQAVFVTLFPMMLLLLFFGSLALDNGLLLSTVLYSVVVYLALGYTYFHLFNMSETARRIRLLYEIESGFFTVAETPAAGASPVQISLATRLERLEGLGQIERGTGGESYYVKGRTILLGARIVRLWGLLLGIDILTRR